MRPALILLLGLGLATVTGCLRPSLGRRCVSETAVDGAPKYTARWMGDDEVLASLPDPAAKTLRRKLVLNDLLLGGTYGAIGLSLTIPVASLPLWASMTVGASERLAFVGAGVALAGIGAALLEAWNSNRRSIDRTLDRALVEHAPGCAAPPAPTSAAPSPARAP